MNRILLKTMLVSAGLMAGVMGGYADDFETYYSQDYEKDGATVDWKTGTGGRYTPLLQTTNGNTYLTVDQSQRNNNGCTLNNSSISMEAGKDFTMLFDMKLGSSNNQYPAKFYVKDKAGSNLFTIEANGKNTTKWIINGDNSLVVNLPGTATNTQGTTIQDGIESSSYVWYTFKLTRKGSTMFLTIVNTSTKETVLERTAIKNLSENGGISGMQFETKRYSANLALDNILVRSVISDDVPEAQIFTVTTKYQLEDGTSVAEDKTDGVESGKSFTPTYQETFDDDNYRYTYVSGAKEISSVDNDATVTIVYKREALSDWTITAKTSGDIEETLGQLTVKDAKDAKYVYPRYIAKDSKLYQIKKARYDQGYVNTISGVKANADMVEEYYLNSNHIAFYQEAEDIAALTSVESGAVPDRCSNGKGAYAAEETTITSLPAGTYKMKVAVFGNAGATFEFKVNDKVVFAPETKGYFIEQESDEFTLDAETNVVLSAVGNGGSSPKVIDYIVIEKVNDIATVTDAKYATFAPAHNVTIPEGVKAYTAKVNDANTAVILTEIPADAVIPANTGIVVYAENANSFTFPATDATSSLDVSANELKVSDGTVQGAENIYVMVKKDNDVVFAPVSSEIKVPAGKAYLEVTKANPARYYSISGGNNGTTGIKDIQVNTEKEGAYYTLQGIKTNKPTQGVYIHNGKKVIIK